MGQFVPAKGIVAVMRKLAGPVLVAVVIGSLSLAAPADAASKHRHRHHHHKAHGHHHKAHKVHRKVVAVAPKAAVPTAPIVAPAAYPSLPEQAASHCVTRQPYSTPDGVFLVCI